MLLPRVLIASAPRAYRSRAVCLSLVAIVLIARGPSAYRSSGMVDKNMFLSLALQRHTHTFRCEKFR